MCGLVGVITNSKYGMNPKQMDVFETLLYLDTLRGEDSTGVFSVSNIGNVDIAKDVGTGEKFLSSDTWTKTLRPAAFRNGWAMIGHNRKATVGNVTAENAHPFWVEDKVVLVHNGSFFGSHKGLADTAVDSHAIAHVLAEHGKDDVAGALSKVNAAYALIWYDVENKRMNFIKNSSRPLHWVATEDAFYFASELAMLEFALKRHSLTPKKDTEYSSFVVHTLTTFSLQEDSSSIINNYALDCEYVNKNPTTPTKGVDYYNNYTNYSGSQQGRCYQNPTLSFDDADDNLYSNYKDTETYPYIPENTTPPKDLVFNKSAQMSFLVYTEMRDRYRSGTRLLVELEDYADTDGTSKEVQVVGKTRDKYQLPIVFNMDRDLIDTLTNPHLLLNDKTVLDITITNCVWKKVGIINPPDINDAIGSVTIKGTNPRMCLLSNDCV